MTIRLRRSRWTDTDGVKLDCAQTDEAPRRDRARKTNQAWRRLGKRGAFGGLRARQSGFLTL